MRGLRGQGKHALHWNAHCVMGNLLVCLVNLFIYFLGRVSMYSADLLEVVEISSYVTEC